LLTDGEDNRSKRSANELEVELRVAGARLVTIMVYRPGASVVLQAENEQRDSVQALVGSTGGSSLAVDSINRSWMDQKTSAANVQMVRYFWEHEVLARYVAHIQVPATLRSEKKWTLSLTPDADPRLKRAAVVYPHRLSPCPGTRGSAR
jgi:hypothetical protein